MQNFADAIIPIIIFIAVISGIVTSIRESIAKNTKTKTLPQNELSGISLAGVPKVYVHQPCGAATRMPEDVIRTYLRDPHFYGANMTFCTGCKKHVPLRECRWTETGEDLQTYTDQLRNGKRLPQSRVQSEIAAFLSGKQQSATTPEQTARPQNPVATQRGNRPPQSEARPAQKPRPKPQRSTASAQTAQKPKQSRPVGSGVAAHVDSFIAGQVEAHIGHNFDETVKKDMKERVKSDLGSQSSRPVEMSQSDKGSVAADNLLISLRSPAGIRHAILVNEILSKPKALRK